MKKTQIKDLETNLSKNPKYRQGKSYLLFYLRETTKHKYWGRDLEDKLMLMQSPNEITKKKKEDKQLSEAQGQYHLVVITFPPSRMEPISSRTKP